MEHVLQRPQLFQAATLEYPFAFYQAALADGPIARLEDQNTFVVYSHALVMEASGRVAEFSSNFGAMLQGANAADPELLAVQAGGWPIVDTLLTADPPVHTRFRKLVNLAFSMPRVNAMEAEIRAIVVGLIEDMAARGSSEFVHDFAVALPVAVIATQIGMTREDTARVKRWSDAFTDRLGGMVTREREIECAHEVVEFQRFMKTRIDARRSAPTDDLLSDLVNARIDNERPLDDAELMSILQQLMVAGNETTTSTLAGGLLLLIQHPDQLAKVRSDPKLIVNMVEEMLRLESPVAGLWRVVKSDAMLGGQVVPAGAMLMLRYAAANRDPAQFSDPDRFDIERRNARTHLAFGRGIHMCIGNMLARKELAVAFEELLARLDSFRLIGGEEDLRHAPSVVLRGLTQLNIGFTRR